MNYDAFARVVANIAIFLEFCSDDIVDEDVAVEQLELLGYELSLMDEQERQLLSSSLRRVSQGYPEEVANYLVQFADEIVQNVE